MVFLVWFFTVFQAFVLADLPPIDSVRNDDTELLIIG